jgi:hypothetical protein
VSEESRRVLKVVDNVEKFGLMTEPPAGFG